MFQFLKLNEFMKSRIPDAGRIDIQHSIWKIYQLPWLADGEIKSAASNGTVCLLKLFEFRAGVFEFIGKSGTWWPLFDRFIYFMVYRTPKIRGVRVDVLKRAQDEHGIVEIYIIVLKDLAIGTTVYLIRKLMLI